MAGRLGMKSLLNKDIPSVHVKDWLAKMDGRRGVVKQMKARWRELATNLGGMEHLSYQERSLSLRLIHVEAWIAAQEARVVRGEPINENAWFQALNAYSGLLAKLGLQRRAKPTNGLQALLARSVDAALSEEER